MPRREDQNESLPIVADATAAIWPDRRRSNEYWYAPTFAIEVTSPNEDAATAGFGFGTRRTGVTAGQDPKPGLDGRISYRVQRQMPAAVTEALAGRRYRVGPARPDREPLGDARDPVP